MTKQTVCTLKGSNSHESIIHPKKYNKQAEKKAFFEIFSKEGNHTKEHLFEMLLSWHIEVAYYEQKKFRSFGAYMLRSKVGIERLTNLLTVLYAFMTLLPFYDSTFFSLSHNSPQQSRFVIGMTIWHELFLGTFDNSPISSKNPLAFASFCI